MGIICMKKYRKGEKRKHITVHIFIAAVLLLFCAALTALKIIRITPYFAARYSVWGVDVSHYQGEIDWRQLRRQGVDFAFIKATEGSGFADERFAANWENARAAGMYAGAYHFFSFDSPASSQAEHFISTAGDLSGALPPVVDIEYYGDKQDDPPSREQVIPRLRELLCALEEEYGVNPIIYTTNTVYNQYIRNGFEDYPLWIRNVYYPPIDIGRQWTFWQYSDTGTLSGTYGEEKYIDLNVYRESIDELEKLLVP